MKDVGVVAIGDWAKAKRPREKIGGRDKSRLTGKPWARILHSTGDCVGPALDPEQLTVHF